MTETSRTIRISCLCATGGSNFLGVCAGIKKRKIADEAVEHISSRTRGACKSYDERGKHEYTDQCLTGVSGIDRQRAGGELVCSFLPMA